MTLAVAVVPTSSRARVRVSVSTAPLEAAYGPMFATGEPASGVETVTIRPSAAARMSGRNARRVWNADQKLSSKRSRQRAGSASSIEVPPA